MAEEQPVSLPIIYTNAVSFFYSFYDVSFMLASTEPQVPTSKKPGGEVGAWASVQGRVVMSPQHFKKFVTIASGILENYEKKYGKIPVEKQSK